MFKIGDVLQIQNVNPNLQDDEEEGCAGLYFVGDICVVVCTNVPFKERDVRVRFLAKSTKGGDRDHFIIRQKEAVLI
jgi:hypothetical protein